MRLIITSASLMLSLLAADVQAQSAKDIAGIKVGVTLASQKNVISKVNPAYRVSDIKDNAGRVVGVRATAKKGKLEADHLLVLSTINEWFGSSGVSSSFPKVGASPWIHFCRR